MHLEIQTTSQGAQANLIWALSAPPDGDHGTSPLPHLDRIQASLKIPKGLCPGSSAYKALTQLYSSWLPYTLASATMSPSLTTQPEKGLPLPCQLASG